jgi:hypothetical protein
MMLIRRDPNPKKYELPDDHQQQEFGIERHQDCELDRDDARIRVDFKRFGRGTERRSDFAVEISWIDVQGFVREFMKMGHSEALYLLSLIRLADAIEQVGWHPKKPPNEAFSDIMPSD